MVDDNDKKVNHRSIKYLDRGMTVDEVKLLLTAPMPDRERGFFRAIYDVVLFGRQESAFS